MPRHRNIVCNVKYLTSFTAASEGQTQSLPYKFELFCLKLGRLFCQRGNIIVQQKKLQKKRTLKTNLKLQQHPKCHRKRSPLGLLISSIDLSAYRICIHLPLFDTNKLQILVRIPSLAHSLPSAASPPSTLSASVMWPTLGASPRKTNICSQVMSARFRPSSAARREDSTERRPWQHRTQWELLQGAP